MSTTTSWLEIPVPAATDPPNGPAQMLAIAQRVEKFVPYVLFGGGALTTSSASLVDITSATVTVTSTTGLTVEILVLNKLSPSGAGDAKVTLLVDGVSYGQIAQVNAGGAALTPRWLQPGSTTGSAVAGSWIVTNLASGSKIIKTQAQSTSGSASFTSAIYVRVLDGGMVTFHS